MLCSLGGSQWTLISPKSGVLSEEAASVKTVLEQAWEAGLSLFFCCLLRKHDLCLHLKTREPNKYKPTLPSFCHKCYAYDTFFLKESSSFYFLLMVWGWVDRAVETAQYLGTFASLAEAQSFVPQTHCQAAHNHL